jgi:hypothetical protein
MDLNEYQHEEIQKRLWDLLKWERSSCQAEDEIDVRLCYRPTTQRDPRANVNQEKWRLPNEVSQLRRLATMMGKSSAIRNASVRLLQDVMRDLVRSHKWRMSLPPVTIRDEPSELHRSSILYDWPRGLENDETTDKVSEPSGCHIRKATDRSYKFS